MKVLADLHHGQLYYSLSLLFEKRLGMELYRPIGYDWFENGFFKVAEPYGNAQDTIDQYLRIDDKHWDAYKSLNGDHWKEGEVYKILDKANNFVHNAITFETFKNMEFDYIIASHPLHGNWIDLLKYQPKAKFIFQLGNDGQTTNAKNVLNSTSTFIPQNQNVINYHQEFAVPDYEAPHASVKINSFVVSLPEPETYFQYRSALPEFEFHAYGVGSPDETVHGGDIPQIMKDSKFGYHVKPGGDGFGHVIHQWFASGRPVITKKSYYAGKLAEPLMIDGVTCIDLDARSFEDNIKFIRECAQEKKYKEMCLAARKQFETIVDFDREAKEVKLWLDNI